MAKSKLQPSHTIYRKVNLQLTPFLGAAFYFLLVWLAKDNPLFWDSILLSGKYGTWFYQHFGNALFVPDEIAGYPPLWGYYIALWWKLFGRSLAVSHLAMLPFLWCIAIWGWQICQKLFEKKAFWFYVLLLAEPSLLGHATQVAPDLALLAFGLGIFHAFIYTHKLQFSFLLVLLVLLSPRGLLMAGGLSLLVFWEFPLRTKSFQAVVSDFIKMILPAMLMALFWLLLFKHHYGWLGYNPQSQWGTLAQFVNAIGLLHNLAVFIFRHLEQGRLLIWLPFIGLVFFNWKSFVGFVKNNKTVGLLLLTTALFLLFQLPIFLAYTNPIGHRYLIFSNVLLLWAGIYMAINIYQRRVIFIFAIGFLGLGQMPIYPATMAVGWDCTLAHIPYFDLKKRALQYLETHEITVENVVSYFPNTDAFDDAELNGDERKFAVADEQAKVKPEFILTSNIFNNHPVEALNAAAYQLLWMEENRGVWIEIWKRK